MWGPNGEINDYAGKVWGGLTGNYYLSRWHLFLDLALQSFTWDEATYRTSLRKFQRDWQTAKDAFSTEETGDTIAIARDIHRLIQTLDAHLAPVKV